MYLTHLRHKSLHILVPLWCFFFGVPGFGGIPQELNRITIGNETGRVIEKIFYTPTYSEIKDEIWASNILVNRTKLNYGSFLSFYIHYPDNCALFNFFAIDSSRTLYKVDNLEICNGFESLLIFEPLNRVDSTPPGISQFGDIRIYNDLNTEIWFMFVSPQEFPMWGFDLLSDSALFGANDSIELTLPFPSDQGVLYDILAIDKNDILYVDRRLINPLQRETILLSEIRDKNED